MIEVRYLGQLGNRLFTYCFARILAEEMNYELKVRPFTEFPGTYQKISGHKYKTPEIIYRENETPDLNAILADKTPRKIIVQAYLQQYQYYEKYAEKIKNNWLKLDPLPDGPGPNDLVIHIRLGDYLLRHWALSFSYYHHLINNFIAEKNLGNIFIISDEIHSPLLEPFKKYGAIFIDKNAIDSLRFMTTAGQIIMSASTFSWWGAFLSSAKKIYFPIPQFGSWSPDTKNNLRIEDSRYIYIENVPMFTN